MGNPKTLQAITTSCIKQFVLKFLANSWCEVWAAGQSLPFFANFQIFAKKIRSALDFVAQLPDSLCRLVGVHPILSKMASEMHDVYEEEKTRGPIPLLCRHYSHPEVFFHFLRIQNEGDFPALFL